MPEFVKTADKSQLELDQLRASERRLRERQELLLRLALSQQNPEQTFDAKLRVFTREVGDFLNVERTSIWYFDRDNTALRCLNLYVRSRNRHYSGGELPTKKFPRYIKLLSEEGVIAADHARTDIQTQEFGKDYLAKFGITSMLDTPLRVGDRLRGVLCCEHVGEPRHWTDEDRAFVISLSDMAALTLATHDVGRTEEMLRALLDSAAQGIVAVDENGKIALVNSLTEKMFLYKRGELLGKPFESLVSHNLNDLRKRCCKDSGGNTGQSAVGEYIAGRRKDGTEFPLEVALSDVQLHDERMSLALLTDVTERVQIEHRLKKSEELYRSVVEDQVDLIARYTPEGIRTFANDAYCRFLGHSQDELIGRSIWEHVPAEDQPRMRENFSRLSRENPVLYYEHRDVTKNGRVVVNQWIDRAVFDPEGNVREIQCIGRDVTKQRVTEERLTAAERLESIAMLASGIAHDFNNLLTPILIYSENLQTRLKEGTIEFNQIQQIHLAADRARTLVRQILAFGRKGTRAESVPAPVSEMIRDALQLIRMSVPSHIRLEADIADDCGSIESDSAEIYQILSNLCTNAIYAMPQGGSIVITANKRQITTSEDKSPGQYVEIVVTDAGEGILPADLNRIFDPFFTTKSEGEGTGLGLSVVHGTVTDLGGTIDVASAPGQGSTFTVLLPIAPNVQTNRSEQRPSGVSEAQHHILLVDDDDLALKSMQLVLKQLGHHVTPCSSAHEAISCITMGREEYDLVLSDFTMPKMSGLELARTIHGLRPKLPILLISGDAGQLNEREAADAGVRGFVGKPATSQEIAAAIEKARGPGQSDVNAGAPELPSDRQQVLVIDDNELVRGSLVSLLNSIGYAAYSVSNLNHAGEFLDGNPVDIILVDNQLEGENGFEGVRHLLEPSRLARGHVPQLVGMTGSDFQAETQPHSFDALLTKPFTAEQLRDALKSRRDLS